MDVGLFLIILVIIFGAIYYFMNWMREKKKAGRRIFFTCGVLAIAYSLVFNGVIDKIFIFVFSIFLIFMKLVFGFFDS